MSFETFHARPAQRMQPGAAVSEFEKEMLKNPRTFTQVLRDSASSIDKDGTGSFSLPELEFFLLRQNVDPKARSAAFFASEHFKGLTDLAEPREMKPYFDREHPEKIAMDYTKNEISLKDLDALDFVSSDEEVRRDKRSMRNYELRDGIGLTLMGLGFAASSWALGGGARVFTLFGLGVAALGGKILSGDHSRELEQQIQDRRRMLSSWGFRMPSDLPLGY